MPKGIYAAASSMYADRFMVEVYANNLANANSSGFRRSVPVRGSFAQQLQSDLARHEDLAGNGGAGVFLEGTFLSHQDGQRRSTGRPFDVALHGDGFFLVEGPDGQALTRQSSYFLDEAGQLVSKEGRRLLGQGGPITIQAEADDVTIDRQGRIYAVIPTENGPQMSFIDQIRVVTVEDLGALRGRDGQYLALGDQVPVDAVDYSVEQGFREEGNVDTVREMVDMIAAQRRYDAAQRVLKAQLQSDSKYSDLLRGAS